MNNIIIPSIANGIATPSKNGVSAQPQGGASFGEILRITAENTVETLKNSEKISAQAITGTADLNDVVQAVTSAELTLQTVMAVRDRAVSALQEILRMPI